MSYKMDFKKYYWLLGILLYSYTQLVLGNTTLQLNNQTNHMIAAPYTSFLIDPTKQLTLENILSPEYQKQFKRNENKHLNFGRTAARQAVWVKFQITNESTQKWYLIINHLMGDEFDLYIFPPNSTPNSKNYSLQPYATPLVDYQRKAWSLTLPVNQVLDVYMRATNGDSILNIAAEFLTADLMIDTTAQKYRFLGAIYVSMLVLAIYQFFMAFILYDFSYFILSINVLSTIAALHRTNPIFPELSFLSHTNSYFFTAPLIIMAISFILFSRRLLDSKYYTPILDKLLLGTALVLGIMIFTVGAIPAGTSYPLIPIMALLILLSITSLKIAFKGNRIALYFSIIFILSLLAHLTNTIIILFIPKTWTAYQDVLASSMSLISMVMISIIQAQKVRILREQSKQIEATSKAKDDFLAIMSHELRTPMHSIINLSTLLKLTPLTSVQHNYLDRLELGSRYMMNLIGNILDFNKVKSNNFELSSDSFQINVMVKSIKAILEPQATQKGLNLVFDIKEKVLNYTVIGDRKHLTQVLINLLINGIKYTQEGTVTLAIYQQINLNQLQATLRFIIKDTGIGIPLQQQQFLFDPYRQLHVDKKSIREGVGLGLTISKQLVELMGGNLTVNSQEGKGSQFDFTITFDIAEPSKVDENLPDLVYLPQGLKVLLVDDSDLNRFVGEAMLQNMGAITTLAADGEKAILLLQQQEFDLVLLDVSMPGLNGFEITQWIRQNGQQPLIPIIALTAHTVSNIEQQCYAAGMNSVLTKPFSYADLQKIIKQMLAVSN